MTLFLALVLMGGCFPVLSLHFGMIPLYGFAYCLLCSAHLASNHVCWRWGGQRGSEEHSLASVRVGLLFLFLLFPFLHLFLLLPLLRLARYSLLMGSLCSQVTVFLLSFWRRGRIGSCLRRRAWEDALRCGKARDGWA